MIIQTDKTGVKNVLCASIHCQDPRFVEARVEYLQKKWDVAYGDYDPLSLPGAGKCILDDDGDALLFGCEVAVGLHTSEKIFVFHHMDCGAYHKTGAYSAERDGDEAEFQRNQLKQVRDKILSHLEEKECEIPEVIMVLEHLRDDSIEYEVINP